MVAVHQDITERKQAETALIESKERLRLALEINSTGAWELNLGDYTSTRTLLHDQIFGYETALSEWTFEMFLEHVIPEDRKKTEALFMEAVNTISDWNFECRIQRPDGEIRWISAIGRHILNSDGKPSHMSGVVQDITENKIAQEALQQITERLQFATEGSNIGTWHWNTITGELIWSSVMKELFDVPQNEVMSYERFSQALHPDDRDRTDEAVKIALDNHTDFHIEYRCIWRDESVHWRSALGRGYYDKSGKNIRMEGVVIDITEQKNAEKELKGIRENLEKLVDERTKELENKYAELERMNKLFVGRELRMVELKEEIAALKQSKA
jgi:PAS domain S-box-containing protein